MILIQCQIFYFLLTIWYKFNKNNKIPMLDVLFHPTIKSSKIDFYYLFWDLESCFIRKIIVSLKAWTVQKIPFFYFCVSICRDYYNFKLLATYLDAIPKLYDIFWIFLLLW